MILQIKEEELEHDYQVRMIQENNIPGLLKCSVHKIDGDMKLYYEISSKQTLYVLFENRDLNLELIHAIMLGFIRAIEAMKEYLLESDHLLVDPNYIYINLESKRLYFCYSPVYRKDISRAFHEFSEYLLTKIDHTDKQAVVLGYEIYKQTMDMNFNLVNVMESLCSKTYDKNETLSDNDNNSNGRKSGVYNNTPFEENKEEEPVPENNKEKVSANTVAETTFPNKTAIEIVALLVFLYVVAGIKWGLFHKNLYLAVLPAFLMAAAIIYMVFHCKDKKKETAYSQSEEYINENQMDFASVSSENMNAEYQETGEGSQKVNHNTADFEMQRESFGDTTILTQIPQPNIKKLCKIEKNNDYIEEILIDKTPFSIGKLGAMVDAVIEAKQVSRMHARIIKEGEEYYLMDLNSTNGTFLNHMQIAGNDKALCREGDILYFADIGYEFR